MSKLYIYADFMSQPVRAVVAFCKINKIEFEIITTLISKGMTKTKEFKKINPHEELPVIKFVDKDGKEFILTESCAILRYLSYKYNVSENWYNKNNLERRARIDQYIGFHHENTRIHFSGNLYRILIYPKLKEIGLSIDCPPNTEKQLNQLLKYFNEQLLNKNFIIDDEISIADLLLYNEIIQLSAINFDFSKFPLVEKYLERMSNIPEIKETNFVLRKVIDKQGLKPKF